MLKSDIKQCDVNNIYYNAILHNTQDGPRIATVYDQREKNVISVANEWEVSIVRFTVPTNLLPILIAPSFINVYSVCLTFGSSNYQQFVPYTNVSNRNLYNNAQAYYCYQDFLDDVNTALSVAFTDLKLANPGCVCTQPPSFFYDPATEKINLFVESTYTDGTVNGVNIFMNSILFNLLQAFSAEYFTTPQSNGKDVRFRILNSNSTAITNVLPRLGYPTYISTLAVANLMEVEQEFSCISNFTAVRSIAIITGQLPIIPEYLPNVATYDQLVNISANNKQIISDFEIPTLKPEDSRTTITYLPTAEYRMVSLTGFQNVNKIDLQVFFSDINGVYYPLFLDVNKTFSVKLLFRRKSYVSPN